SPFGFAGIGVAGEDSAGPEVVARALRRYARARVAGAVEDQVGLGVVGDPTPGSAGAVLPHVPGPAGHAQVLALHPLVERMEVRPEFHILVGAGGIGAP